MDQTNLNEETFTLKFEKIPIEGTVTSTDSTASFTPEQHSIEEHLQETAV